MTSFNGYPISILLAVLLHGSVLAALFYFQQANTEVLDVIRPPSVRANLVGENPQVKNALVQQQQQQRRVEEQRAEQRRQEEQRQAEARQQEEQRQAEAERRAEQERNALRERQNQERQQAEQRQSEEQRQREEQQRQQREEEQRQQAERAAQEERERQEQALQAQRDAEASQIGAQEAEAVMSYTTVIHDLVQQQWSRPPSARNGMVAVLRISMLPTGDVTDVQVVQSSGDFAFDRAAETAVRRVNRFTELQGMNPRLFDRSFRSFLLTFRPEDLLN